MHDIIISKGVLDYRKGRNYFGLGDQLERNGTTQYYTWYIRKKGYNQSRDNTPRNGCLLGPHYFSCSTLQHETFSWE